MTKNLYIKTFGCQMNVYDSEKMESILKPLDYSLVLDPEIADLVILNTCHIREKASEKLFSDLGKLKKIQNNKKSMGKDLLVAVGGCVAQAQGEEIIKRAPNVSIVFGPQSYQKNLKTKVFLLSFVFLSNPNIYLFLLYTNYFYTF